MVDRLSVISQRALIVVQRSADKAPAVVGLGIVRIELQRSLERDLDLASLARGREPLASEHVPLHQWRVRPSQIEPGFCALWLAVLPSAAMAQPKRAWRVIPAAVP